MAATSSILPSGPQRSMYAGHERFHSAGAPPGPAVVDFWRWAAGDLVSNRNRGILAEFLVASALGATHEPRQEWDDVDVRTRDGLRVEVKSASYVQTWKQRRPSTIQFGIEATKGWDARTNEYSTERRRWADIYVFCVLGTESSVEVDPTDLDTWRFFVLPTEVLDRAAPGQKTITLGSLMRRGPVEVGYCALADTIRAASGD